MFASMRERSTHKVHFMLSLCHWETLFFSKLYSSQTIVAVLETNMLASMGERSEGEMAIISGSVLQKE